MTLTNTLLALILVVLAAGVVEHSDWLASRKRAAGRALRPLGQWVKNWKTRRRLRRQARESGRERNG